MTFNLKNKLSTLATLLFTALFVNKRVYAADDITGKDYYKDVIDVNGGGMDGTFTEVNSTLKNVLGFARGAGIVVCVIMIVWCAIQLAMSSGNNQKRQLAMEGIKNVIIAIAIIGGATVICSLAYGILA